MKHKRRTSAAVLKSKRHGYKSQKNWRPLYSSSKLKAHKKEMAAKKAKAKETPKERKQPCIVEVQRSPDGRWLKGTPTCNQLGAPRLGTNRLEILLSAVRKIESKHNLKILEHFVEKAYTEDSVLIALIRKLHPDISAVAISSLSSADESMTNEMALQIQQELRGRYSEAKPHKKKIGNITIDKIKKGK